MASSRGRRERLGGEPESRSGASYEHNYGYTDSGSRGSSASSDTSFLGDDSLEVFKQHVSLAANGARGLPSSRAPNYYGDHVTVSPPDPIPVVSAEPLPLAPPPAAPGPNCTASEQAGEALGVLTASPYGQHVQIDIMSTWGDPYYVGLSALELFDDAGEPIEIDNPQAQVRADPADINVLPEYGHDERVVSNLFDGTLRTCDNSHLWLAPFTPGRRNYIFIDLGFPRTLSMLRVWNYNKSRIHSFRGAKFLEVRVDGVLVFRGEVNKAPGALHEAEAAAEAILFTVDAHVLARIEEHDRLLFEYEPVAELPSAAGRERPLTAERQQASSRQVLRPTAGEVGSRK